MDLWGRARAAASLLRVAAQLMVLEARLLLPRVPRRMVAGWSWQAVVGLPLPVVP